MQGTHGAKMASGRRERGFALLITVTLLAFLVLLLVSLASLTRVETQVAGNHQNLEQARQNALMALNIAIGQLQKYAGPDARVTAESAITSAAPITNPHYAGVWVVKPDGTANTAADMWLVSGSEQSGATAAGLLAAGLDPGNDTVTADQVFLVGNNSVAADAANPTAAEKTRRVKLVKQDIKAGAGTVPGVGAAATPVVGRYAWWVGDQGVKASLALPDRADEVTYAPWDTQTQRRRIRQQIGSGPNYFRAATATTASTKEGFDPFTAGTALNNVRVSTQLGYLTPAAGSMSAFGHAHFHDFTTAAYAVLANTLPAADANRGLMHDLSLSPTDLGAAYAVYASYATYMEAPGTTVSGADTAYPPITDADSVRRRYKIVAPTSSASATGLPDFEFGVAPALTDFMLQFRVQRTAKDVLTVRARLYVALWNPYSAALAPTTTDDLSIEVLGLPQITVTDPASGSSALVDLQAALTAPIKGSGSEMRVGLPFGNSQTSDGTQGDRSSWLPGRVYGWATETGATPSGAMQFYNKNISAQGWAYPAVTLSGAASHTSLGVTTSAGIPGLEIKLKSAAGVLATYKSPDFQMLNIAATTTTWKFAFAFRLKQPVFGDSDRTWLKLIDPRRSALPATAFGGFDPNQDITPLDPSVYMSVAAPNTAYPQYLLYRIQGSLSGTDPGLSLGSYNDVPVFELPRLPLLSTGELQHIQVKDTRPFAIGNSWGGTANRVFDRFFFSGLPASVSAAAGVPDLGAGQPLPNWNLRVVNAPDISTVRATTALSSQYLLQAGGFNLNSTNVAAWRAVLSSVRFAQPFTTADIENTAKNDTLGTQKSATTTVDEAFNADATLGTNVQSPTFFRFSQSAQETYFWKPVSGATNKREFSTHAFRLGVRGTGDTAASTSPVDASITAQGLTTDQIETLAAQVVSMIKTRASTKGPFRSLEEFLGPQSGVGTASLLEDAIAAAAINAPEVQPLDDVVLTNGVYGAGFSSLTLTQADILTALAPFLRVRSDTFTIRSYGESINPATGEVSGKAFLEATIQRFPDPVNGADSVAQPAGSFGRKFKIISFRWLSPSDI